MDGALARSCLVLAVQADGAVVETIEGLSDSGEIADLQAAFHARNALQCGYCTPGMLMTVRELLANNPDPTDDEIRLGLAGNLCRCTGYVNIVRAVRVAASRLRAGAGEAAQ
jgi:aerobic carbon-monoxide dehydrogenase small subunit